MLYLLKKENEGSSYCLIDNEEYTIGRKGTDILIEDDVSISRLHAVIKIKPNFITIIDKGSKYKVFINGEAITPDKETKINLGDIIKFGRFQSVYRIENMIIKSTCSGLNKDEKKTLVSIIENCSGKFISDWSEDCTHLTVEGITLTIKYLHALISGIPVVTTKYWKKLLESIRKKSPAPNVADYQPPMAETILMGREISTSLNRRNLFQNKVFVFPDEKNRLMMNPIIEKCGGTSIRWNENEILLVDIVNSLDKYIFIKCDNVKTSKSLEKTYKQIAKLGQRLIPIQEIAFAIFTCSCIKDCNPNFNIVANVFKTEKQDNDDDHHTLALETQTQNQMIDNNRPIKNEDAIISASYKQDIIISDSCKIETQQVEDQIYIEECSLKRYSDEVDNQQNKKIKYDNVIADSFPDNSVGSSIILNKNNNHNTAKLNEIVENVEVKKRKAEPMIENQPAKKIVNPFARMINRTNSTNNNNNETPKQMAFPKVTVKTDLFSQNRNPFADSQVSNVTAKSKSTSQANSSNFSLANTSKSFSTGWMSKPACESIIKIEDEHMQEIFDKFRDTVVVQSKNIYRNDFDDTTVQEVDNSKNFKKFRKIKPKCPQSIIINTNLIALKPNVDQSIVDRYHDVDQEEEEEQIRPVVTSQKKIKTGPRKFDF